MKFCCIDELFVHQIIRSLSFHSFYQCDFTKTNSSERDGESFQWSQQLIAELIRSPSCEICAKMQIDIGIKVFLQISELE